MKWRVLLGIPVVIFAATASWSQNAAFQSLNYEGNTTGVNSQFSSWHSLELEYLSLYPEEIVVQQKGPREFDLTLRYKPSSDKLERLDGVHSLRRQLYNNGQLETLLSLDKIALELGSDDDLNREILCEIGLLWSALGNYRVARDVYHDLIQSVDPGNDRNGWVEIATDRLQNLPEDADDMWPILERAEALVHSGRMQDVARLYHGLLHNFHESGNSRTIRKLGDMLRRHQKFEEMMVHYFDLGTD